MSDTSLVFNLIGKDSGVNEMLTRTSNNVKRSNTASAASSIALGVAMASAGANALALAAGVAQAAGAVIALPAMAIAAAAGLGVLKMATMNLGAALKVSSGGAAKAAFDYAGAEHRVEIAQRGALRAQQALDDARRSAAENIARLSQQIAGANLDEESSVLRVAEAKAALAKARAGGDVNEIAAADLAYRQALQTLDETRTHVKGLKEEQTDAAAKGVEGADQVVRAIEAQRDATYELAQARKALADAGKGSGGGADPAAQAFAKLAPAAQALVLTIRSITPAWQGMQRAVQQAVFAGVAGDVRALSDTYLPVLTQRLVGVGSAWNVAIRSASGFLKTPAAVTMVDNTLANVVRTFDKLALAVKPALNAFLMLAEAGSGALPGMAGDVLNLAERFERFIASAKESGKLAEWAQKGVTVIRQLATIAWNLGAAFVAVFRAGGAEQGAGMLAWLTEATGKMAAFLNSAEGQEKISGVLTKIRDIATSVVDGIKDMNTNGSDIKDSFKDGSVILGFVADHLDLIAKHLPAIVAGFVAYKAAQTGANVAAVAMVPVNIARIASQFALSAAMTAHTAALTANTAATGVGATATTASGTAAAGASGGFWALTAALLANPITWIVLAIIALVAIIVLLATKTQFFQKTWDVIWGFLKEVGAWFAGPFADFFVNAYHKVLDYLGRVWDYVKSLPGKLKDAFFKVTDFITTPFKTAFNFVAGAWNKTIGKLHWNVPNWVPGIGGNSISVPQLPMLASGGVVPATPGGRFVGVAEGGESEVVAPLSSLRSMLVAAVQEALGGAAGGAGGDVQVTVYIDGEPLDKASVRAIRSHPEDVAYANRAGAKKLNFAG